jgi:hypothetical protein
MNETAVVKQCLQVLSYLHIYAWRNNTQGTYLKAKNAYMFHGKRGVADIIGLLPSGRFLAVEVKAPKKLKGQSEVQKEFQAEIEKNGGIYLLVDSAELLQQKLSEVIK